MTTILVVEDDYVTKPFSPRELVARVKAVLRRSEADRGRLDADAFRAADLVVDSARMRVTRDGEAIDLTPSEHRILETLARHAGRVFTGIAPEELPRLFERFHKAPGSSGSGLGLAIARQLVEAHGGTIEAASAPGEGTTITVSLPAR